MPPAEFPKLDHGPLVDHWDEYQARFGELQIHFHKLDNTVVRRIDQLVQECVRRGSPMTREELAATGYQHPVDGLFY